jgi:hypothetical protein
MRYVVGLVAVASIAAQGLTAVADPPGTVKLNTQRSETPQVRILGASDAGVLYTVLHPDIGTGVPIGDPSGLEIATWLKPTGKPAVRLGHEYTALRGDYVFAAGHNTVSFRRIDTGEIRTCTSPLPDAYVPTGWLDSDGGDYRLTTIGATGCRTRSLAGHPGTFLKAADESGFVVAQNGQLRYATYASPATLKPIATGNQHGQQPDLVTLDGSTVAWRIQSDSQNWLFRGSTTGTAPTEIPVNRQITSIAVTPTHTAWASDERAATIRPSNLLGTVPVGSSTTSTERAGTNSVVSDGSQFVVDAVTTQAGPHRTPNAGVLPVLIQGVDKMAPLTWNLALGGGRVVYTDSRGTGAAPLIKRGYRQGNPPVVGAESVITYGAQTLSQDGRRTAFLTRTGVWLLTEGGTIRWLAKPVAQPRMLGGVKVSGTRVMWMVLNPGPACDPIPLCPPPYPESVYLYDARTHRTVRVPGGPGTVFGLWGNYFLAGKADGSIYRRALSGTRVERVKGPGQRLSSVDGNGSWVGWSTCPVESCPSWYVGYRNMLSSAPPVQVGTFHTHGVRLTGGHLVYESAATWGGPLALRSLKLGSTQSTVIAPVPITTDFDAHDETVAWIGHDFTARIAPNTPYAARPRYLGNAIGAASFHPGRWTIEFPISKALPICGVTIRRGTTAVRSLGCATQTGSAIAAWDGRDSAGRRVPNGTYTWTFNGRDADGWLLWWNGSPRPITGTVTVR